MPAIRSLSLGVVALLATSCQDIKPPIKKATIRPVKLYTVTAAQSNRVRSFPGTVVASDAADLSFRISGQLTFLVNREGQAVKQGQILARIDDRDAKNQLAERQAAFDLAVADEKRKKSLLAEGVLAQASYDKSLADLQGTRAALALARDNVQYTVLKAPFSGIISKVWLENYQFAQVRQTVMSIESRTNIDISFEVPEQLIVNVRDDAPQMNYKPEIRFSSDPDTVYRASYKENSSQVTRGSQTYTVILTMPRPGKINLLPGMAATVTVDFAVISTASTKDASVMIPARAVVFPDHTNGQNPRVWRFAPESQTVHSVEVAVGTISDAGVAVLSGLQAGDQIVSAGHQQLAENQQVKPWIKERGL